MELSGHKLKKFPYSSYILAGNFPSSKNIKPTLKQFPIFFQNIALIFPERTFQARKIKTSLYFLKKRFSYISGNGTF